MKFEQTFSIILNIELGNTAADSKCTRIDERTCLTKTIFLPKERNFDFQDKILPRIDWLTSPKYDDLDLPKYKEKPN